jgi:(R)-2-hydroxyacyl-CoA dehydratese activating ATPase
LTGGSGNEIAVGIDIGSRMTKIVTVSGHEMIDAVIFPTGHDPLERLKEAAPVFAGKNVVATGYGRRLVQSILPCGVVTEIRACAHAARFLFPDAQTVIDIGGQDSKAIELIGRGFGRFEMNDRCAAGTGCFLEVMAKTLGYRIEEFGAAAMQADLPVRINSMCTVFAESEVVSLIAKGEDRLRIALGLHLAVARRMAAMASRVMTGSSLAFVGGVANNPCMVSALSEEIGFPLTVPDRPEFAVALGAALIGMENKEVTE